MRLFARWRAVIVSAVVLIAGAVVWWRVSAGDNPPPPRAQEQLQYFEVPTSGWQVGSAGHDAGLFGTLRFTTDGCPFVDDRGHRTAVVMPDGARGVIVGGVRSIVDPKDFVYGTEGDKVEWAGGGDAGGTKACTAKDEGRFSVEIAPQNRRIDGTTVDPNQSGADRGNPRCQKSKDPPDDVEHFDASPVARKLDLALRKYISYAATIWHAGGGLRVRIAANQADTDAARAEAKQIIADLPVAYRHAVKIDEVTVSLHDLREWVADARDDLTYIQAKNIIDIRTDVICLYVDMTLKAHSAVRLTDQERTRYKLSGFQLVPQQ